MSLGASHGPTSVCLFICLFCFPLFPHEWDDTQNAARARSFTAPAFLCSFLCLRWSLCCTCPQFHTPRISTPRCISTQFPLSAVIPVLHMPVASQPQHFHAVSSLCGDPSTPTPPSTLRPVISFKTPKKLPLTHLHQQAYCELPSLFCHLNRHNWETFTGGSVFLVPGRIISFSKK